MGILDIFGSKKKEEELEAAKALEQEQIKEKTKQQQKKEHEGLEWPKVARLNPVNVDAQQPIPEEDTLTPERKDEVGDLVFDVEIALDQLADLNTQELLFLLTTLEQFNKHAELANYESNHRKVYNEILNRVRSSKKMYALYDMTTGYPYIDHGYINIYLDKDLAEKAVEIFKKQYRSLAVRECPGEADESLIDENGNRRRSFFDYLYYIGADQIIIDNGGYRAHFRRTEIVADPGDWQSDNSQKVVANPQLCFAMLDFLGEVRWPVKYEKRPQVVSFKELRMASLIRASRFIVPMQQEGPVELDAQGRAKITKDTQIKFLMMKDKDEKEYIPIFTDGIEFSKKFRDGEWRGGVFTFQDIISMARDKAGVRINPFGQNIVMPTDKMIALEQAARKQAELLKQRQAKKNVPLEAQSADQPAASESAPTDDQTKE